MSAGTLSAVPVKPRSGDRAYDAHARDDDGNHGYDIHRDEQECEEAFAEAAQMCRVCPVQMLVNLIKPIGARLPGHVPQGALNTEKKTEFLVQCIVP